MAHTLFLSSIFSFIIVFYAVFFVALSRDLKSKASLSPPVRRRGSAKPHIIVVPQPARRHPVAVRLFRLPL